MGADGLILASLFLITPNYMCEVRVSGRDEEFDFIDLKTVRNYRINLGKHVLKREGGKPIRLKTATITLLHFPGFVSELAYIGDNPEKYVKTVTQAIPITCASFQQA